MIRTRTQFDIPAVLQSFEDDDHYLVQSDPGELEHCVFYFSSHGIYFPNDEPTFRERILIENRFDWFETRFKQPAQHVFVRDVLKELVSLGDQWSYQRRREARRVSAWPERGASGHHRRELRRGFAALLFGSLLGAERIFAFNPQVNLRVYLESDDHKQKNPLLARVAADGSRDGYLDICPLLAKHRHPIYYFFPGNSLQDRAQYGFVRGIDCIRPFEFISSTHGITMDQTELRPTLNATDEVLSGLSAELAGRQITPALYGRRLHGMVPYLKTRSLDLGRSLATRLGFHLKKNVFKKNVHREVYVDVKFGLGNRMRALATAMALIEPFEGCRLNLVWTPDHHCECSYHDLFEESERYVTLAGVDRQALARRGFVEINHMAAEGGRFQPIDLGSTPNVYVRSAYLLSGPGITSAKTNAALRRLTPVRRLREVIDSYDLANAVGVHIRCQGGESFAHLPWEHPDNVSPEGYQKINLYRGRTQPSAFFDKVDAILRADPKTKLYLCSDRKDVYEVMIARYGDSIIHHPRDCFDRSQAQLEAACIDLYLLSRTRRIIGSTWSSFTDVAHRLGGQPVELVGRDS